MNRNVVRRIAGVGTALVTLSLLMLGLSFAFGGDPYDAELIGEPLDEEMKEDYIGTNLEFIAETGRVIYRENGSGEIIWDPPHLPTLRESVRMYREAVAKNDTGLIPLCSDSFSRYLKAARKTDESLVPKDTYFPACQAVPSGSYFGPPSDHSRRFSDNDQSGTISMGNVRFYNLDLRDATTWHDWTNAYSSDTAKLQEGGYTVTTTSRFHDFYVSD